MPNPVYQKELKLSVKSVKLPMLLVIFNGVLAIISFLTFYGIINQSSYNGTIQFSALNNIYSTMTYIEFAMFMLIVPAVTSGSISGERERKTLDLLLASKMTPLSIVIGKLEASLNIVKLLVVSSLPLLSVVFIFGGIRILDLLILLVALFVSGLFAGSMGLLFSACSKKTTTSTVLTYAALLFFLFGTYGILMLCEYMENNSIQILTNGMGHAFYLFLVNPGLTFMALIGSQMENSDLVKTLCSSYAPDLAKSFVVEHWILISLLVQSALSVLMTFFAGWLINPLRSGGKWIRKEKTK